METADKSRLRIVVTLDVMTARRKVKGKDLAAYVGITEVGAVTTRRIGNSRNGRPCADYPAHDGTCRC